MITQNKSTMRLFVTIFVSTVYVTYAFLGMEERMLLLKRKCIVGGQKLDMGLHQRRSTSMSLLSEGTGRNLAYEKEDGSMV